jgi:hypothetical protein
MNEKILRFFEEVDAALAPIAQGKKLDLYHLGRSSLVLHHDYPHATKDVDVVEFRDPLEAEAQDLFGKGSAKATALGLYLEFVPHAFPPVPGDFRQRCKPVPGDWQVIRLWKLDDNDLAATKLRSFRPQDREDLRFLCDEWLLDADQLRASLESAFRWTTSKDGDDQRDNAFANLEKVIAYLSGETRTL